MGVRLGTGFLWLTFGMTFGKGRVGYEQADKNGGGAMPAGARREQTVEVALGGPGDGRRRPVAPCRRCAAPAER